MHENTNPWYDGKNINAKERRILISHCAGEAWDQLCQPKYDHLRLKCWASTGCLLLTADGSDDHLVKPEGLPNCVALSPINAQPVQPQLSAPEPGDEDDPDKNEDSVEEKTEFVAPEEDGNVFDMFDQYYL